MFKTGGILLCAGYGSRLAPLTDVIPKPAIPFCGVPMAHYALRSLERAGISALGMNVHHLPERMVEAMHHGKWCNGMKDIVISRENDEILGTGGGAARVARLMPDCERYIIYHGDVLCAAELEEALISHEKSGAQVTLVVLPRPRQIHENVRQSLGMIGVVNHEIICIRDWFKNGIKLDSYEQRCFCGIHIVEKSVLDGINPSQNVCLVTQIYRQMLERGERIHAYEPEHEVFFADVGTPATYLDAQSRCLAEHVEQSDREGALCWIEPGKPIHSGCGGIGYLFGNVDIPASVSTGENLCIHAGSSIKEGECLENEMRCEAGGIKLDGAWCC